jgi:nucleoside-diphosphate-sugar epimerase
MLGAIVCGAGGFIGGHLVTRLKAEGWWVRGVDLHPPEFKASDADDFVQADLRGPAQPWADIIPDGFDAVFQLAADMGGMGYISVAECEIMRNNALINANVLHASALAGIKRYFFSSSVCVYRDMEPGEPALDEDGAYPAQPDNEYGWEKLYAERMALAYGRQHDMAVRIARFQNCYGPFGTYQGGREKAPAALCRKVAEAEDGGSIEVWGDGGAVRNYIYVDDLIDGIYRLALSDLEGPANIGGDEYVTVDELARTVALVAGKRLTLEHIDGPVGVRSRNFSSERIKGLGWQANVSLEEGLALTYPWIERQVLG